ncbi:MAG: hypothetical protein ACKV0T_15365 [Planctomycetales bacterium]
MDAKKLTKASAPKALGGYLVKLAAAHVHHDPHAMSSTRKTTHHGHEIMVETSYRITIDGKPIDVPLMVGDDGQVHCHSLPNYQFGSALDLVKVLIDLFPDDMPKAGRTKDKGKPAAAKHHRAVPKRRK